jgi:hypothetical protein
MTSLYRVRAITICVDYADLLRVTLPRSQKHFHSVTVVTTPGDEETIGVVREFGADLCITDVFYDKGADFNKFAALEYGLGLMGREGWLAVIDADIYFPLEIPEWSLDQGCLYTPRRRMFPHIPQSAEEIPDNWLPYAYPMANEEFAGYCQIFHADDAMLGPPPWYETNWIWAGGPDSVFQQKWPDRNKIRPPFEVLHLGPAFQNWAGRIAPMADGTPAQGADRRRRRRAEILERRNQLHREGKDMFSGERME